VNYGNRFIPEDWMIPLNQSIYGPYYGAKPTKPDDIERISLCDVTDQRMMKWLDDTIKESDFQNMKEYGV
jgi:hypothetical protein